MLYIDSVLVVENDAVGDFDAGEGRDLIKFIARKRPSQLPAAGTGGTVAEAGTAPDDTAAGRQSCRRKVTVVPAVRHKEHAPESIRA